MSLLSLSAFAGTEDTNGWPGGCYHCDNVPGCTDGVWFNAANPGAANKGAMPICALPGWEDNIDLSVDTMFIGDSDIARWDSDIIIPNSVNVGVGGYTCDDVNGIIDGNLQTYNPKWVVIVCGENDLFDQSVSATFSDFKVIIGKIIASGAQAIYVGTKPEPSTKSIHSKYQNYDALIREYADSLAILNSSPTLVMIDVYPAFINLGNPKSLYDKDRLHLSSQGYGYWNTWTTTALNDPLGGCIRWSSNACDSSIAPITTTTTTTVVATTAGTTTTTTSTTATQEVVMALAGNTCPNGYVKLTTLAGCQSSMNELSLSNFAGTENENSWPGGCYYCNNVPGCTNGVWFNFATLGASNGGATPICAVPGWETPINCLNDSDWQWTNNSGKVKKCDWVARRESRCNKIGDDGITLAREACPEACNAAC